MKLKFLQLALAASLALGAVVPAMAQKKGGDAVIAMTAPPTVGTFSSPTIVKRRPCRKKTVRASPMTGV